MDAQRLILVVEDDEATRAFLLQNLAVELRTRGSARLHACSSPKLAPRCESETAPFRALR
jgi:hypothetical protein